MTSPIFFDGTGRRRKLASRVAFALLAVVLAAAAVFAATVISVPSAPALELGRERSQPAPFITHVARLRSRIARLAPGRRSQALGFSMGFYVPWDEASGQSLRRHIGQLDWVVADLGHIDTARGALDVAPDPQLDATLRQNLRNPAMVLMVQNFQDEKWDGPGMARILADRRRGDALIAQTIAAVQLRHWRGAMFDLESLPDSALPDFLGFLNRAHAAFSAAGLDLSITAPASASGWNLSAYARAVDHIIVMDYDQHWQGGEAGPIAAQDWFEEQLDAARKQVPVSKLIIALGSYAYDWHGGQVDALTAEEAWLEAHDSGTRPSWDPASGTTGFAFDDDQGQRHTVWMLDAASTWNQLRAAQGVGGFALWRLGSEDPGYWTDLAAMRLGQRPDLAKIAPASGTDVEGSGEVLRIGAAPTGGSRSVAFLPDGRVAGEQFGDLPTPFLIRRSGGADPKAVVLTFDDGPDPDWTPQILDILEQKKSPATFFVIGENALVHPELIQRIAADGDEIGNHSYTHPNLAQVSALGVRLELNATQRLIEAYTGHSTRLFRAPYFGDAEPTTADELVPAQIAQDAGYTIVGLHADSEDWQRPGVDAIVEKTVRSVEGATADHSANVVLLHDGGGDRAETIAALPRIIDRLRADGYRFTTIAGLSGLKADAVMPVVRGTDRLAVGADVALFLFMAGVDYSIRFLFFFAIALGIGRAVVMTALALMDRAGGRRPLVDAPQPPVSVIIPAYNEEAVIVASIARVLASDYPALELIVADDGSKDATSALVSQHYGADPRVTLMTLTNCGNASVLNRALARAGGESVIALDADTHFLPDTIAKLVRWFADPQIGAVAGNAQVGNRINLVTRWQAIEYVTAQNVERRALDALGAITVVPGAVGAWRRSALDAVGGYPEDTLAEDQDLTIAIQRKGWKVGYDIEAVALTEAPETFAALAKQRFRWSFGTLQCLWKHRAVIGGGRPRGLAWFGMPQAWLFQILFAAISPMIDLALVVSVIGTAIRLHQHGWEQTQGDVLRMAIYWFAFVSIDILAGWVAYRLEPRRQRFPALLMVAQRFVYRQLMYSVVIRSISAAVRGRTVGWGKLERSGSVTAP
ncbi:MAG: polysaccharide deacetylase family protein [Novosphingobium sp.]